MQIPKAAIEAAAKVRVATSTPGEFIALGPVEAEQALQAAYEPIRRQILAELGTEIAPIRGHLEGYAKGLRYLSMPFDLIDALREDAAALAALTQDQEDEQEEEAPR